MITVRTMSWLMLLVLVFSAVLTACGGEDAAETPKPTEAAAPTEPPAAEFECDDALGCVDIAPGDPLKLATLQAISGAVANLGEDQNRATEIALGDRGNELRTSRRGALPEQRQK